MYWVTFLATSAPVEGREITEIGKMCQNEIPVIVAFRSAKELLMADADGVGHVFGD